MSGTIGATRNFVSNFGVAGLLPLAFGICKGAWVGILIGVALMGVDVLMYFAEQQPDDARPHHSHPNWGVRPDILRGG